MAKWTSNNGKLNDMATGFVLPPKSSMEFLQNCDLPPPQKVFSGADKAVISPINQVFSMMGQEGENEGIDEIVGEDKEQLELLKALRLSQTRAREAERKAATLAKEKESISNALLEESLRLFAYRQFARLLEVQVSKLQSQLQRHERHPSSCWRSSSKEEADDIECRSSRGPWMLALALCLGIAGVGFALGSGHLQHFSLA